MLLPYFRTQLEVSAVSVYINSKLIAANRQDSSVLLKRRRCHLKAQTVRVSGVAGVCVLVKCEL
jgi:hypothetical protein